MELDREILGEGNLRGGKGEAKILFVLVGT